MRRKTDTKKQSLGDPQDEKSSSHSSFRPEDSPSISSQGELSNGSLEPVHGPSGSQIYPHNEKSTASGGVEPRKDDGVPLSVRWTSPQNHNTPDSPICTPRKAHTLPTKDSPVKPALGSNRLLRSDFVENQRDAIIKDLGSSVPRGSLEYFKKILPPIRPEFDINKISSHLIKNGYLVQKEGIYVWNEFRLATIATTEMQSFSRTLVNVLNAICDAALETSGIRVAPTVDMVTDEDNGSWSVNGSSATLYGYLKLKEGEERVKRRGKGEAEGEEKDLWYNIAVSLSLKTVDDSEVKSKSYLNFSSKINSFAFTECSECCSQYETCISS